jgi:hypothetical protein
MDCNYRSVFQTLLGWFKAYRYVGFPFNDTTLKADLQNLQKN